MSKLNASHLQLSVILIINKVTCHNKLQQWVLKTVTCCTAQHAMVIDPDTPRLRDIDLPWVWVPQTVCCADVLRARWYLSKRVQLAQCTTFYINFFIDLQLIYADEKYMGILLLPNCTCVLNFNLQRFLVFEQSPWRKTALSPKTSSHAQTQSAHLMHRESQVLHWRKSRTCSMNKNQYLHVKYSHTKLK